MDIDAIVAKLILGLIEQYGLFIVRLNNGDWMVGKATHIYHIEITQNHYADPNVSISHWLNKAVQEQIAKIKAEGQD